MTSRRLFMGGSLAALARPAWAQEVPAVRKIERPPALDPALVKDFVGAAHGNLEKTQELLARQPGLLNATWDWGGGDFEAAIGGAGHMGRKDIAAFLIAQGARIDIFVAAMMGQLQVVQSLIGAFPEMTASRGPHGITLMAHALKGGPEAGAVVRYLESLPKRS